MSILHTFPRILTTIQMVVACQDINHKKWNGLKRKLVYVTRRFNTLSEKYQSPLYIQVFSRYKRKTRVFHFPLTSRERFHVLWRSIYLQKRLEMAGDISYFNFQSVPFCMVKNVKTEHAVFMFRFPRFFTMENGTDWKLNQPMSRSISVHFQ